MGGEEVNLQTFGKRSAEGSTVTNNILVGEVECIGDVDEDDMRLTVAVSLNLVCNLVQLTVWKEERIATTNVGIPPRESFDHDGLGKIPASQILIPNA